jgi:hypothetical protein
MPKNINSIANNVKPNELPCWEKNTAACCALLAALAAHPRGECGLSKQLAGRRKNLRINDQI